MAENHLQVRQYQIPPHLYRDTSQRVQLLLVIDYFVAFRTRGSELEW